MHCLVTAGPTFEPLDAVRRLTNFSTGRLGIELAGFLVNHGHEVTLLLGEQASWPAPADLPELERFTTTADLGARLARLAARPVGAVFHAAAVSDFGFGRVWRRGPAGELAEAQAGKLPTAGGSLLAELTPTPKLIASLRDWFPSACLVGWKYEVDGQRAAALARGGDQLARHRTDACVVNGPAYGEGFGLLSRAGEAAHFGGREELFLALLELVTAPRRLES